MSATWYDLGEKVLAVCPKAGSQSIRSAMGYTKETQAHVIEKPVIWFIRHPIERVKSCYRYFSEVGFPDRLYFTSYESFVDAILDGVSNRHWDRQKPQVTYARRFVPTEMYPFDYINELWDSVVGVGKLPHRNASTFTELPEHREDELHTWFWEDIQLHEISKGPSKSIA